MTRILWVLLAPLFLTGCFLSPGQFVSELELMAEDQFAFTYEGEIQMAALSDLAEMAGKEEFVASCEDDDGFPRDCTEAEIAEQRAEWEATADERAAQDALEAEQMKMMLGGFDPSDPEAAGEFARMLERQRGWNRVDYKGDGLFDVSFAIEGTLSHDFNFPTIEKLPMATPFVSVNLRKENQVRVDAPGFAAQGAGNPMQGMMTGMMGMAQLEAQEESDEPGNKTPASLVMPRGTFTIVTNGRILANNTDEGAAGPASRQVLSWAIDQRTEVAPTALIAF